MLLSPSVSPGKRARAAFCPGAFKRQLLVAGLEGRSMSLGSQQLQVARRLCQAHVQCPLGASAQGARFRTRGVAFDFRSRDRGRGKTGLWRLFFNLSFPFFLCMKF